MIPLKQVKPGLLAVVAIHYENDLEIWSQEV